jgi:thymidine kinase
VGEIVQALPRDIGWVEVVCGPMFSGKTSELIRRMERCVYARQEIEIFKPSLDTRYAEMEIVSHSEMRLTAKPVSCASEILERSDSTSEVVGIDEAQFFDESLVPVVQELAARGKRVIIAGTKLSSKNWASSIPTTSLVESERSKISLAQETGLAVSRISE